MSKGGCPDPLRSFEGQGWVKVGGKMGGRAGVGLGHGKKMN